MPSKRSIDEWKKKYKKELSQVIKLVGNKYLQLNDSEWTILDSTPIPDYDDEEALTGHSSMGALTAVLALQAVAISNLIEWGYPSVRTSDVRA